MAGLVFTNVCVHDRVRLPTLSLPLSLLSLFALFLDSRFVHLFIHLARPSRVHLRSSREPTIISERRLLPDERSSNDPAGPPSPYRAATKAPTTESSEVHPVAELRPRPFISRMHLHPRDIRSSLVFPLGVATRLTLTRYTGVVRSKFSAHPSLLLHRGRDDSISYPINKFTVRHVRYTAHNRR